MALLNTFVSFTYEDTAFFIKNNIVLKNVKSLQRSIRDVKMTNYTFPESKILGTDSCLSNGLSLQCGSDSNFVEDNFPHSYFVER